MKLIVAGATGLVGGEIVRQALRHPEVTSIVALARRTVQADAPNADKMKSVVVRDYGEYPDHVQADFAGADACIWTVAVTPFLAGNFEPAEVKRVCQDCMLAGFKAMYTSGPARPFRFVYFSAEGTPRDLTKKPLMWGDYQIMRGECEHMVLGFPAQYPGTQVVIAQPGLVTTYLTTLGRAALASLFSVTNLLTRSIPNIDLSELAAASVEQAVRGFDKDTLLNNDLVRIGKAALKE